MWMAWSAVTPDGEFISRRLGEMEAAPTGKGKGRFDNGGAMLPDQPFCRREVDAVEDDQHTPCFGAAFQVGRIDSAIKASTMKRQIGPIGFELPAKGGGKEGLCRRYIRRGKFDIIDFVMDRFMPARFMPARIVLPGHRSGHTP